MAAVNVGEAFAASRGMWCPLHKSSQIAATTSGPSTCRGMRCSWLALATQQLQPAWLIKATAALC